jgi:hypothetical protein
MMTMKKWYFSKDSKVTGPFTIEEAERLLAKDPDFYAWHPSLSQWQPVSCIEEFFDVVPTPVPAAQIPDELIEEFIQKKQRLHNKLSSIAGRIEVTEASLYEFEKEISIYKRLTHNLSDEVKANITSIETNYDALHKNLTGLKKVAEIAKVEINDIVTDFDNRVATKTGSSTEASKASPTASENKIKLVSTNKNTPAAEKKLPEADLKDDKAGFSGVKSVFKSVFKSEDDDDFPVSTVPKDFVESPQAMTEGSQALAAEEHSEHDDEEEKAKRMRRRRRRR